MAKVHNKRAAGLCIGPVELHPGDNDLTDAEIDLVQSHEVTKAWVAEGWLVLPDRPIGPPTATLGDPLPSVAERQVLGPKGKSKG